MEYSNQIVVSDGTLQLVSLTFPYIDKVDVHVSVDFGDGPEEYAPGTIWDWVGSEAIRFNEPLPDGAVAQLQRQTEIGDILNKFTLGAMFNAPTLDENFDQLLYIAQEYSDVREAVGKSLRVPSTEAPVAALPGRSGRAGKLVAFDNSGEPEVRQDVRDWAVRASPGEAQLVELPPVEDRANKMLAFDSAGQPTAALPVSDSATELRTDLANPAKGAAMVGYGGGTVADKLDEIVSGAVTEPFVDAKVGIHNHDADAHPEMRATVVSEVSVYVTAEADRAETARDAAFVNADVYPDVAAGLAAVADGEQFQVAGQHYLVRYVRVNASTAEEVARLANGGSVAEFVGSSYDLLKSHAINLFQGADLPVRRYTAAGVFSDYAPGYSQAAVSGGVRVTVPVQGSGTAKHHLLTREYGGPYAKVRAEFTNITGIGASAGVGLGFIDSLGVYRAYLVTSTGNLNEVTDGFTVTNHRTGLGTFAEGASAELVVDGGVLTAKVNGVTWVEHTLPDGAFTGQLLAVQNGFLNYTVSLEVEADPVREYVSGEVQRIEGD